MPFQQSVQFNHTSGAFTFQFDTHRTTGLPGYGFTPLALLRVLSGGSAMRGRAQVARLWALCALLVLAPYCDAASADGEPLSAGLCRRMPKERISECMNAGLLNAS